MTARELEAEPVKKSRRAIIAGALGGVGAWALAGIGGKASPVRAEGQAVVVGGEYTDASSVTAITNPSNDEDVIKGISNGAGRGVYGKSGSGNGVYGESSTAGSGVTGASVSGTGVAAFSTNGSAMTASSGGGKGLDAQGTVTGVQGSSTDGIGISAHSSTGFGLTASSTSNIGIVANSTSNEAIHALATGTDKAAVVAWNRGETSALMAVSAVALDASLPATKAKTGVFGYSAIDKVSKGIFGESPAGTGVYGTSATGYAFRGNGRVKFEKVSGVASIAAGSTSKTVSPGVDVTASSFVLLSPRANLGGRDLWFTVDAAANTFKIHMSASRGASTPIGWLLIG
jgi:hypothetical protein